MISAWVVHGWMCVCMGCRCVKQGDSDSDWSAGHVWTTVMDAKGTVISKTLQGHHDRAWYVYACILAFLNVGAECVLLQRVKTPQGTLIKINKHSAWFFFPPLNLWIEQMFFFMCVKSMYSFNNVIYQWLQEIFSSFILQSECIVCRNTELGYRKSWCLAQGQFSRRNDTLTRASWKEVSFHYSTLWACTDFATELHIV